MIGGRVACPPTEGEVAMINRMLLSIALFALSASACWHVGTSSSDAGATDADNDSDTDADSDSDSEGETDTDPFDDYDCDDSDDSSQCEAIVCAAQDQYENALLACAEGDEPWCQLAEECLLPYGICIDGACAVPNDPDLDALSSCLDTLTDCTTSIAP